MAAPGTTTSEATRVLGGFLRDVIAANRELDQRLVLRIDFVHLALDGDGRRIGIRRHRERQSLPRHRFEDRQGIVVGEVGREGECESDDV